MGIQETLAALCGEIFDAWEDETGDVVCSENLNRFVAARLVRSFQQIGHWDAHNQCVNFVNDVGAPVYVLVTETGEETSRGCAGCGGQVGDLHAPGCPVNEPPAGSEEATK